MIASSGTALANLAYLIGAVVVAVIGGLIVWARHRQPRSVDANMASFRRGLSALAPDARPVSGTTIRHSDGPAGRSAASGLTHVRLESSPAMTRSGVRTASPADEPVDDEVGGHSG